LPLHGKSNCIRDVVPLQTTAPANLNENLRQPSETLQGIALLLWKYGRSDLVKQMGIDETVDPQELKPASAGGATPDQLADDLEAKRP